ncbi:hypothetical protein D8771_12275 [Streptomyces albus]|uniref:Uncharacterized protein n=1 Tax=Streptomyces albus TaxID=1888 RepID=A0A8H1QRW0_9ACTN|nr:hypothetical protein D8771_12275 [Streptomyces albus]
MDRLICDFDQHGREHFETIDPCVPQLGLRSGSSRLTTLPQLLLLSLRLSGQGLGAPGDVREVCGGDAKLLPQRADLLVGSVASTLQGGQLLPQVIPFASQRPCHGTFLVQGGLISSALLLGEGLDDPS